MKTLVTYELEDSIATITMDDGKVNVLSLAMLRELNGALDRAVGRSCRRRPERAGGSVLGRLRSRGCSTPGAPRPWTCSGRASSSRPVS